MPPTIIGYEVGRWSMGPIGAGSEVGMMGRLAVWAHEQSGEQSENVGDMLIVKNVLCQEKYRWENRIIWRTRASGRGVDQEGIKGARDDGQREVTEQNCQEYSPVPSSLPSLE